MPQKRDKWFLTGKIGSQSTGQVNGHMPLAGNGHENPPPPAASGPISGLPTQPKAAPSPEISPPVGTDNGPNNQGNQGNQGKPAPPTSRALSDKQLPDLRANLLDRNRAGEDGNGGDNNRNDNDDQNGRTDNRNDNQWRLYGPDRLLAGSERKLDWHGSSGNDYIAGGAGNDIFNGGIGNDRFVLELGSAARAKDAVTDFASGDKLRVDTANGNETTLTALQNAADIRWTNNTNEATGSTNDAAVNDTVIYWKNGTPSNSDDVVIMVLEDYTTALTMTDFEIV